MHFEVARDAQRIVGVGAHAVGQGVDAAEGEPAIEGRRHRSAVALRTARALEQVIVVPGNERAAHHVAVAADVLGGGVAHHVDAAIERALEDGGGESAVADGHDARAGLARKGSDGGQVGDLHERV